MNDSPLSEWPLVSVIIPVRNEEKFIENTLRLVLDQDYPKDKLEVFVVDGRSDDSTREKVTEIAASDPRVKLLDNPKMLSSAARNIGARAAGGEIVTFIDGHVFIPNNQLIKSTVSLTREQRVSVLSRPQFLDTPDNTFFQRAVAAARKSHLGHGLDSTIYLKEDKLVDPTSSGASYRKEVFTDVGYFDESFDAAEDVDFNFRVGREGYKSFTSIKLAVYYFPRKTFSGLFRQMERYGIGRFRLFRKHKTGWTSGAMLLAIHFLFLSALLVLSIGIPSLFVFWEIYLAVYLAALLTGSLITAIRGEIAQFFILPPIYLAIHGGLAYGFIKEAIRSIFDKGKNKSIS